MNDVEPQQLSELVAYLEELARRNATPVTYSDVVRKFRLPKLTEAWTSHPLARVFENLDAEDHEARRPFRTTLVVQAARPGIPGDGYYHSLSQRRGIKATSRSARLKAHRNELKALYEYWEATA